MAHNSEAVRLAEASDWKGLQRLIEIAPELASERGDYGMLPIHWACTEPHVPVALLDKLLAAYPDGARTKNAVHLLPLHIAIRARVQPLWLRRLLTANPLAVHVPTPEGLTVLELADQVGLSGESMKVLIDAYGDVASPEQDDASSGDERDNNNGSSGRGHGAPDKLQRHYELLSKRETRSSGSSAAAPASSGGKRGSARYQLLQSHSDDDDDFAQQRAGGDDDGDGDRRGWPPQLHGISRLTSTDTSDPVGSPLLRSLSSLSDVGTLDSLHDGHLISPSSTSTSSQAGSPSSANSAPLPPTASIAPPLHKQMPGPFQRKHSLDYHRHAAAAAVARQQHGNLPKRSRNQLQSRSAGPTLPPPPAQTVPGQLGGRHQSLPVIPSFENFRFAPPPLDMRPLPDMYHDRSSGGDGDDGDGFNSNDIRDSERVRMGRRRFQRLGSTGSGFCVPSTRELDTGLDAFDHEPSGQFESPPAWKRDDECAICRASFGMFKHRHHCRNCGKSICSQHSADRKVSMTSKGFKTPQRVCVTCYAMLAHQQQNRAKCDFDTVLDAAGLSGPNPVAAFAMQQLHLHQHQTHYALGGGGAQALRSPQFTSLHGGSSPNETFVSTTQSSNASLYQPALLDAAMRKDLVLQSHVNELRHVVAAQQRQIEALVQTNMQMQQQVLEQEEAKAETTLLITQLMTRVSVLELQRNETQRPTDVDQDDVSDAGGGAGSGRDGNLT